LHAALDDRVLDADKLGEARFEHDFLRKARLFTRLFFGNRMPLRRRNVYVSAA
jgi:hypothetical protein